MIPGKEKLLKRINMKIGSIVECINIPSEFISLKSAGTLIPKLNSKYTVREIIEVNGKILAGIRLDEIVNPVREWDWGPKAEAAFLITAFREIEFPPALEEEIKESLTRELVER